MSQRHGSYSLRVGEIALKCVLLRPGLHRLALGIGIWGAVGLTALAAAPAAGPTAPAEAAATALKPEQIEFFEKQVRPILAQSCYSCHGDKVQQAGLRLDSREAILRGGANGPAAVAGKPETSILIRAIHHIGTVMPPGRKLPPRQITTLEQWVKQGLPWPSGKVSNSRSVTWEEALRLRRTWWSLNPPRRVAPPAVADKRWNENPVDRFLYAAMSRKGLRPAAPADRSALLRRATLAVIGLPPTVEQVAEFIADRRPDAYERQVDKLLASPQFGERWARHWMDVVRYGETHGYEWNYEVRDAWRYRDYLIRAFNTDVPYDQFVREHLAGDLLPRPRINTVDGVNESPIGTAFFRFGEAGHDVFKEIGLDVLDNQIDTLSKAFQGATISCARCHDHKLDAVSMKDYYALLGILHSSRQIIRPIDTPESFAAPVSDLRGIKDQIRAELGSRWRSDAAEVGRYLAAAQSGSADGLDPQRLAAWKAVLTGPVAGVDDPLQAWRQAVGTGDIATAWRTAAAACAEESRRREEFNRRQFEPWGNFADATPGGWRVDGVGLWGGPAPSGEFVVALEGDRVVEHILPAGRYTHLYSQRLNGAVQSPDVPKGKSVWLQVIGGKRAVARTIPDHRHLNDAGQELKPERLNWIRLGTSPRDERNYVEVCTKLQSGRWDRDRELEEKDPRSYFGITRAYLGSGGESPKASLDHLLSLYAGPAPATLAEVAQRYAERVGKAVDAWTRGTASDADVALLAWLLEKKLLPNGPEAGPRVSELVRAYRGAEAKVPAPRVVVGLADQGPGFDHPIYARGDFRNPGEAAPRRYLQVISGEQPFTAGGSGRQELADRLVDPSNPLTARVMANRVWYWLFGTGLVRTVDDLGHMGDAPSHPELLDWLAVTFAAPTRPRASEVASRAGVPLPAGPGGLGWSVKRLVRLILMSQAFQQSSRADVRAQAVEPDNRLLHHFPARRAEAEVIRDSLLAVSGRLDLTLYGPSIHPYRLQEKGDRKLFAGPLDGNGRRSVYIRITLMEGPPFLSVFNQPEAKVSQGRRDLTNVPAQALALLNDPFVIQQADVWATRLISEADSGVAARVERMFLRALSRRPTAAESARFVRAVTELGALEPAGEPDVLKRKDVWRDIAHALFNLQEFVYIP